MTAGHHTHHGTTTPTETTVLSVAGMQFASEQHKVETHVGNLEGVTSVEMNPVSQSVTVTFDPTMASATVLEAAVIECGYHCAGRPMPAHLCEATV